MAPEGKMDIWHKSAMMGEILNPFHKFKIFITSKDGLFVGVSLPFQITNDGGSQKTLFITVDPPPLDDQVEAFQVGFFSVLL